MPPYRWLVKISLGVKHSDSLTQGRWCGVVLWSNHWLVSISLTFSNHFFNARSENLQDHNGSVSPRPAGNRPAGVGRRSGLIQARNRHAMLRVARHRPHGSRLRRPGSTSVTTSMPIVGIHALQIDRAFDGARQNFVFRQIWGEATQEIEIGIRHVTLDGVPMLRPLPQLVGLIRHNLNCVHSPRRSRGVGQGAANYVQRRTLRFTAPVA